MGADVVSVHSINTDPTGQLKLTYRMVVQIRHIGSGLTTEHALNVDLRLIMMLMRLTNVSVSSG